MFPANSTGADISDIFGPAGSTSAPPIIRAEHKVGTRAS